jgi:hypothetical protein
MKVDDKPIDLMIRGSVLTTYQSLLDELNNSWKRVAVNQFEQAQFPYYGQFSLVANNWTQWDGSRAGVVKPVSSSSDPTTPGTGDLWFDLNTNQLKEWSGSSWILPPPTNPVISYASDPTIAQCDEYWFDGTTARIFDGVVWKDVTSYISAVDPASVPNLTCTNIWRQPTTGLFQRWNDISHSWVTTNVLTSPLDPLALNAGTLWYDPMTMVTSSWNGLSWVNVGATISVTAPVNPTPDQYWVNPLTRVVQQYNVLTSTWAILAALVYHKSPTTPTVGEIWYNSATTRIYEWDGGAWVEFTAGLFNQLQDPAARPELQQGALWYNSTLGLWFTLVGSTPSCSWVGVSVIQSLIRPSTLTSGYWFNTTTRLWYRRNGAVWTAVFPTTAIVDPTTPLLGSTWYDGVTLWQWDATSNWVAIPFSITPVNLPVGTRWLNTTTGALTIWSGTEWQAVTPPFIAAWNDINNINVVSTLCGEPSMVEFISSSLLFTDLGFTTGTPILGLDGYSGRPLTEEIGVGTDGSADERRKVIHNLYTRLGAPITNVELSRDQMDLAVQKGLDYIRRDSGAGNARAYFFLDLKAGQQKYILTSRAVGFNTIVDVLNIYRTRGSLAAVSSPTEEGGDLYGQQMIQSLYSAGTFDLLSYHLMSAYQSLVNKLFVREFQFQWTERSRSLSIMRSIGYAERILIDAVIERTEQDLLTDRMTKNWIEDWALSEAMIMLGNMRGKFSSLAGAGGSITLNAESLKSEAVAMQTALIQELEDFVASDIETWGIGASITKG